jgi:hypothetical protein
MKKGGLSGGEWTQVEEEVAVKGMGMSEERRSL